MKDKQEFQHLEQEAEKTSRRIHHHVHHNIPGEVFLLITALIALIALFFLITWSINHPADFISTSTWVVHIALVLLFVGAVIGLVLFGIHVFNQLITKVIHPIAHAIELFIHAMGQRKRNKVLAKTDQYVVVEHQDEVRFHQVSQERTTNNYKGELPSSETQAQLSTLGQPTQTYAISQLQENGLQVCLGTSKATSRPFVRDLEGGTHYNILGGSGMGKSCFAASILDQVTTTNDPDHLLIGLLDLEHKTSRLFENLPHLAELDLGRKRVDCIAQTPDEVGEHFGYLHQELDRRTRLSEYDLQRERFLLIYVEEFLSLKYEIDPDLKDKMLADFSILALRGRKYKLYLLACAQVSYADKQLREATAQFNVKASFSVIPSAARAAGFAAGPLLKTNFEQKQPGQLVLETTGCSDIMLAPQFDVRQKLLQLDRSDYRSSSVQTPFNNVQTAFKTDQLNDSERAPEDRSDFTERERSVLELHGMGWNKQEIVEKLWKCKKGSSQSWQEGSAAYDDIMASRKIGA